MKRQIFTNDAPAAIGPYSQAIQSNGILYISGQLPVDPRTGKMCLGDIKECTKQVLDNMGAVLAEAQLEMKDIVKMTVFMTDLTVFAAFNEAYAEYFSSEPPARSAFAVAALPLNSPIEIEAIAHLPGI